MKLKVCCQIAGLTGLIFFGASETYNSYPAVAQVQDRDEFKKQSLSNAVKFYQQGEYQKAITLIEETIPLIEDDLLKGKSYNNLAAAYYQIGNLPVAIAQWNLGIDLFKKLKSIEHYTLATIDVSQAYVDRGLVSLAIPRLTTAISVVDNNAELAQVEAKARGILGDAYRKKGDLTIAIAQYQESLDLQESITGYIRLSQSYRKLSAQNLFVANAAKETAFDLNVAQNQEKLARKNSQLAISMAQLALKLAESQDIRAKIAARVQLLELLFEENTNKIVTASNIMLADQKSQLLSDASALLNKVPNSRFKAERLIQIAALVPDARAKTLLDRAVNVAEEIGDRRTLSFAMREIAQIYLKQKKYSRAKNFSLKGIEAGEESIASDNLFYLYWQLGQIETAQGQKENAVKSYKSALWNLRSNRDYFTVGRSSLFFQLRERVNPFLREYAGLLLSNNPTQKEIEKALETISLLKVSELQIFYDDPCFQDIAEFFSKNREQVKASSKELQIYSLILPKRTHLILKKPDNSLKIHTLALEQEKLEKQIEELIYNLRDLKTDNYFPSTSQAYDLLIRPFEKDLKESDDELLVFVNDGVLRNAPMETLYDGQKFLIQKYPILYKSGLNLTETTKKIGKALIFGLSERTSNFPPLPYVREEVDAVEKIVGGEKFIDRDFTESNLASNIAQDKYSVLHIATHGVFGGSAQNSFLLTTDKKINLKQFNDILLDSSSEISLLTLSACSTLPTSKQATLGFAGVAIRNGVQNVLGTLWTISDSETAIFIEDFYSQIYSDKLSFVEAKRQAQIEQIERGNRPYYWSSIILINSQ
ncbi:MAG: CHAT domain-containing protein [Prochloraceae cyanobacterium]|nr:CHAT domain-containing protein [Prochloraceae cyanobacterium]